ncbi:MAG: radical SAM protein [bacterium]
MHILLVNTSHVVGKHYVVLPPLNLGYIAEAARRAGHTIDLVDAIKDDMGPREFGRLLDERGSSYDIMGFSYFSPMRANVLAFSRMARERFPSTPLVVGGPHPIFEPEETLQSAPWMDFAMTGEGEESFPALLAELGNGHRFETVPNLAWRDGDVIRRTPGRPVDDIDKIPIPAWDLMRPDRYPLVPNGIFSGADRIAPVMLTRGCPYPCKFCGAPTKAGKAIRTRNAENVAAEAELLMADYGVEELHVMDDVFTTKRANCVAVCEAFLRMKHTPRWMLPNGIRLDSLDEELLRLLERAGCWSFAVGIESGSQRVLDLMDKRLDLSLVHEKVELIKRVSRIKITGFFMIGFPGETEQEMNTTIDLACSLPIDRANFFNYTPFPGGPLYYHLKESGKLGPQESDRNLIYSVTYAPPGMTKERIKHLLQKAYCRFYLRPKILWGLVREIHSLDQVKNLLFRAWNILW